jgi:hypothetical protein
MDNLQLRLQEPETTVAVASQGLSGEARMVSRYAELKAIRDKAEEEMKDISRMLLDHYNETGERANNGAQEVSVSERKTYAYEDARLKEERPELFGMLAKIDPAKVTALVKAKVVTEEEMDLYRSESKTQVLTIRAMKDKP